LELAADVERWLADEPVSAWREPLAARARRWLRRRRGALAATAVALVVAVGGLLAATVALQRANRHLLAAAEHSRENYRAGVAALRKSRDELASLAAEHPRHVQLAIAVASACRNLGAALGSDGQWNEAWDQFAEARRRYDELSQIAMDDGDYQALRHEFAQAIVELSQRFFDEAQLPLDADLERRVLQLAVDALDELQQRSPLSENQFELLRRWNARLNDLRR
jgi:hypothetical protein